MGANVAVYAIAKGEEKHAQRWAAVTAEADYRLVVVDHASHDNTAGILHDGGVHVVDVDYGELGGFRFDTARNYALGHLPDSVDVCVVLDMDETLDAGWADALRAKWDEDGGFDKGFLSYFPGEWGGNDSGGAYPHSRMHSRHGWQWECPCHEDIMWQGVGAPREATVPGVIVRQAELPPIRARSNYLPLLTLAVAERPTDSRMATYYARQLFFDGHPADEVIEAIGKAIGLKPWDAEGAYLCRIAAGIQPDRKEHWLRYATEMYPSVAEAWLALADFFHDERRWPQLLRDAERGLACPRPWHYLSNTQTPWRLHDYAALASWHLGEHLNAAAHGARALADNPTDHRLVDNFLHYADGLAPARHEAVS